MFEHPDLPWPKINDYLMEITTAHDLNKLLHLALLKIGELIPFDHAGMVCFNDIPERVVYQETYGGSESCYRDFQQYYCRIMPNIGLEWTQFGATDWYDYQHTEYVTDFIRPYHIRYSAGISQPGNSMSSIPYISMNRSNGMPQFSEVELKTLQVIQGHLANYLQIFNHFNPEKFSPNAADIRASHRILTPREAEITALLCQKYSAEVISSRLLISTLTVYKHIENIYTKLKVNCRKDLRCKLLEPDVWNEEQATKYNA